MKLSVIIPVYNVEQYLSKSIESVLLQGVDDCEIILVNDCSTDGSGFLCDEWAKKESRIKVIHCDKNGGLSRTRNIGIQVATGEFITFVDSDDFLAPDTYKDNLKLLEQNSYVDVLEFPAYIYYGSKKEYKYTPKNNIIRNYIDWINAGGGFYCYAWNKIYRRVLWKDLEFPEDITFEDIFIILEVVEKSGKILSSSQGLYYYCDRENSISNRVTIDSKKAYIQASMFLYDKLVNDKRVEIKILDDFYLYLCNAQIVLLQLGGDILIPERHIPLKRTLFVRRPIALYIKAVIYSLLGKKYCIFMAKMRNLYSEL